ncbi:hypothetical protein [Alkalicoccobacillus murimartini]|uniref:Transcription termination factor NusB n=1 Tax=Alkalicoccobacillus murimartini TaxID=171685 RepID=A0ABT9YG75_9BACI|nr:hypothetical protein [Alkalicoccobacillus murimartini]MDQ0206858.1 transcription termination factor NusB [Alkalicoccobacillus murimartini]
MITKEEALSFASSITKSLAEAKGHTHFLKTIASLMRRYYRADRAFDSPVVFIQSVVSEYREYLSNVCVSIEQYRSNIRESLLMDEDKVLLLVDANVILVALRKILQVVEQSENLSQNEQVQIVKQYTESFIPGLPVEWAVSKKGKTLDVHHLKQDELKEPS